MTEKLKVVCFRGGTSNERNDRVIREVPFRIRFDGTTVATLMSLPSDLCFLGWGFLICKGWITSGTEVKRSYTGKRSFSVFTRRKEERALHGSSGNAGENGVRDPSGKMSGFDASGDPSPMFSVGKILDLAESFFESSTLFQLTGGTHASALCSEDRILYGFEDIGRHNSVQKVIGKTFLDGTDPRDKFLLVTGRVSAEMVGYSARCGISLVVSHSAPTSLAVSDALDRGITVAGFARGDRLNIYAHSERIAK